MGTLTLRHPRTWRTRVYPWAGSVTSLITYLSPQKLHDPRITKHVANGTEFTIGEPVSRLSKAGVLITWTQTGFPHLPGDDLLGSAGIHLTVDGYPARLVLAVSDPGCTTLGGKQSITGTFLFHEVITMRACIGSADAGAAAEVVTAFRLTKVTAAVKTLPGG